MSVSCRCPRLRTMELTNCCHISRPANVSAARAPKSTNTVCTSALWGIWPFLSASSSFRGVGCSVFSPVDSAISFPPQHAGHGHEVRRQPVQIIGDILGGELQRETENNQRAHDAKA